MPNWVQNIMKMEGDSNLIEEIYHRYRSTEIDPYNGDYNIDFNKIKPMPEDLNIESGSSSSKGYELYSKFIETLPKGTDVFSISLDSEKEYYDTLTENEKKYWEIGKKAYLNVKKYGFPTWYEWCRHEWGTKWNASECHFDKENTTWCFQTAWSTPLPVIEELARKYPDIKFTVQYADEDLGYNCGEYSFHMKHCSYSERMFDSADEQLKFACDIWGYDYDEIVAERDENNEADA